MAVLALTACGQGGMSGEGAFERGRVLDCRTLDVSGLYPAGSRVPREFWGLDLVDAFEWSSCYFGLDTNGDGLLTVYEDTNATTVSVSGGLSETVFGGNVDNSQVVESDWWAAVCFGDWEVVQGKPGWSTVLGCREDDRLVSLNYLLVGSSADKEPASVACSVSLSDPVVSLDGREESADEVCGEVRMKLAGF